MLVEPVHTSGVDGFNKDRRRQRTNASYGQRGLRVHCAAVLGVKEANGWRGRRAQEPFRPRPRECQHASAEPRCDRHSGKKPTGFRQGALSANSERHTTPCAQAPAAAAASQPNPEKRPQTRIAQQFYKNGKTLKKEHGAHVDTAILTTSLIRDTPDTLSTYKQQYLGVSRKSHQQHPYRAPSFTTRLL